MNRSATDYYRKVSERLKIDFSPKDAYKLCDIKPALGYIHFDGMSGVSFFEVVLTSNGLLILRAFAEGQDGTPTLGEKLAQHIQGENPLELRNLVTQALNLGSQILSPMTRSGI